MGVILTTYKSWDDPTPAGDWVHLLAPFVRTKDAFFLFSDAECGIPKALRQCVNSAIAKMTSW